MNLLPSSTLVYRGIYDIYDGSAFFEDLFLDLLETVDVVVAWEVQHLILEESFEIHFACFQLQGCIQVSGVKRLHLVEYDFDDARLARSTANF